MASENPVGVPIHGGAYTRYNWRSEVLEISARYGPPFRHLGSGAYGLVFSALDSHRQIEVAIKKIRNAFDNDIVARRTLREIALLRHIHHENVIGVLDVIQPPQRDDFNDVYVVSELMDASLSQVIHSSQRLSNDHCRYFLYQMLRGLKYLHSGNILHRDLKPSNLLINADNCDLKIADFGLSRTFTETGYMTEYVVTRYYRAPELLVFNNKYTPAVDVWSVACIFVEMHLRRAVFPGKNYLQQLNLIVELLGTPAEEDFDFVRSEQSRRHIRQMRRYQSQDLSTKFPEIDPVALDLVEKMLVFNPGKRITVEEALAHEYLDGFHDIDDEPTCAKALAFPFEQQPTLSISQLRELIYEESLIFQAMKN